LFLRPGIEISVMEGLHDGHGSNSVTGIEY
jgi:hypothetical protein